MCWGSQCINFSKILPILNGRIKILPEKENLFVAVSVYIVKASSESMYGIHWW